MLLRTLAGVGLCIFVLALPLAAQDFRVSTRLFDEHPALKGANASQPIARTTTIFHAGKVYDYNDNVGEITILEPAQKQFVILNKDRMLATSLPFEEIERILFQARQRAAQRVSAGEGGPNAEIVQFQLNPAFKITFDEDKQHLRLTNPHLTYEVRGAETDSGRLKTYLKYADWTARLNYLLHPQMLPGVRLALNTELEKRELLPTEIRLQSPIGTGLKLRAEHRYHWSLTSEDRRQISDWEALLQSPSLKFKNFREFQQEVASE